MRRLFLFLLALGSWSSLAAGQFLLPNAQQTFVDRNGAPLGAGFVFTYVPGTTTPLTTYVDSGLTTANPNPIVLDAAGRALIWVPSGTTVREIVQDAFGSQQWDQLASTPAAVPAFLSNGSVGSGPVVLASQLTRQPNPGNLYVSPLGSDSADCLAALTGGGHGPCLTIQKAVNAALTLYDLQGAVLSVNVAAGTYTKGFMCAGPLVGGATSTGTGDGAIINVVGNSSTSTIISDSTSTTGGAVVVSNGCAVQLSKLTLSTSQSGADDLLVQDGGIVELGQDMAFGSAPAVDLNVTGGALVEVFSNFSVSGNTGAAIQASNGGRIVFGVGLTVTVTGTPTYSVAFVNVLTGGVVNTNGAAFSGSANGPQGVAEIGGAIYTVTQQGTNYFPGSTAFVLRRGGIYQPEPASSVSGSTGGGSGATANIVAGSNGSAGTVSIVAGSGASATGTVTLQLGLALQQGAGVGLTVCTAALNNSGTAWAAGGSVAATTLSSALTLAWSNSGGALINANNYFINYICRGD